MKKALSILLAMVLGVSLVACGSGKPDDVAATEDTAPAAEEAATEDEGGEEAEPVVAAVGEIEDGAKLVYWSMWGETEPQGMVIAEAIAAFTAETGVEVEAQWGARETRKTLEPALDGGETIDIFDEDIERVFGTWGKYLLDLTDLAEAEYDGVVYRDQINSTLVDLIAEMGDGRIFEIPYQPSTFVTMYNKTLFEEAGIESVPTNKEEFEDACEKLLAIGITPITVDDAYMGAFVGYNLTRLAGVEETYAMVDNVDFSHPAVLEFAEIWEGYIQKGYMSSKAATNVYPDGQNKEIATEEVAMYLNGTWLPNEIKGTNPNITWGAFAWPAFGAGAGTEANNYGAQCFGINKDTQYPNAAFALVRWLTTGTWDQKLADESMGVPIDNGATWPVEIADAQEIIANTTTRLSWAAKMEDNDDIHAAIKDNFSRLVQGSITAQEFADNMAGLSA